MLTNEQLRELLTDMKHDELNHKSRLSEEIERCTGQISQIERLKDEYSDIVKDDAAGLALMDQASAAIRDNLPKLKETVRRIAKKVEQAEQLIQQCDDCLRVVATGNNVVANVRYGEVIALARQNAGLHG